MACDSQKPIYLVVVLVMLYLVILCLFSLPVRIEEGLTLWLADVASVAFLPNRFSFSLQGSSCRGSHAGPWILPQADVAPSFPELYQGWSHWFVSLQSSSNHRGLTRSRLHFSKIASRMVSCFASKDPYQFDLLWVTWDALMSNNSVHQTGWAASWDTSVLSSSCKGCNLSMKGVPSDVLSSPCRMIHTLLKRKKRSSSLLSTTLQNGDVGNNYCWEPCHHHARVWVYLSCEHTAVIL